MSHQDINNGTSFSPGPIQQHKKWPGQELSIRVPASRTASPVHCVSHTLSANVLFVFVTGHSDREMSQRPTLPRIHRSRVTGE